MKKVFATTFLLLLTIAVFLPAGLLSAEDWIPISSDEYDSPHSGVSNFALYADSVLKFAIVFSALLAVVMIVIAGFQYITAQGNVGATEKAKDQIWNAILGLLVVLGSYLILNTINPDLVNLNFGITQLEIKTKEEAPKATAVTVSDIKGSPTTLSFTCIDAGKTKCDTPCNLQPPSVCTKQNGTCNKIGPTYFCCVCKNP